MTIDLLRPPSNDTYPTITRIASAYNPLDTFALPAEKHYQQQYSDIYFLRLAKLKPVVEQNAAEAWNDFQIGGNVVRRVERVLDVRQGELCWVTGTVYLDMPLKPNILDDISKDHWISVPPPRQKYRSPDGSDQVMLEDESGRLRLIGSALSSELLVTGCIIAVMGTENANGDFEVVDLRLPEMARQPARWERDDMGSSSASGGKKAPKGRESGGKVAIVSGLEISGDGADSMRVDLLMEFLMGEATCPEMQKEAGQITRLIIAGNALAESTPLLPPREDAVNHTTTKKSSKKYGYDSSAYNPAPTSHLDHFLAQLLPTMPVTLIPGPTDPANVSLPQQRIHTAMLPQSRAYSGGGGAGQPPSSLSSQPPAKEVAWFDSTTNPWEGDVQGWRMLGMGGQPVDDIFKYMDDDLGDDGQGEERIDIMHQMLRWRCSAPTAPDTLWCYPYQTTDPFTIHQTPHLFFVGNQPAFHTALVPGPSPPPPPSSSLDTTTTTTPVTTAAAAAAAAAAPAQKSVVRLIALPSFRKTGLLVLVHLDDDPHNRKNKDDDGDGDGDDQGEVLKVEVLKFDV